MYRPDLKYESENLKIKIYIHIILLVLFGWGIWSLMMKEEYGSRVCENIVVRKIFGPQTEAVIEEWRKLHNEELHNLYCLPNIITEPKPRRMRWGEHGVLMVDMKNDKDKGKVIPVLFLTEHHPMKVYWGVEV
jgi:hypothetical protein